MMQSVTFLSLLTVLLFNINSNFITDLCQPGIRQCSRFLESGPITKPRSSLEQARDCPVARVNMTGRFTTHTCPYILPCPTAVLESPNLVPLNPLARPFQPKSSINSYILNPYASVFLPTSSIDSSILNPNAAVFHPTNVVLGKDQLPSVLLNPHWGEDVDLETVQFC